MDADAPAATCRALVRVAGGDRPRCALFTRYFCEAFRRLPPYLKTEAGRRNVLQEVFVTVVAQGRQLRPPGGPADHLDGSDCPQAERSTGCGQAPSAVAMSAIDPPRRERSGGLRGRARPNWRKPAPNASRAVWRSLRRATRAPSGRHPGRAPPTRKLAARMKRAARHMKS